MKRYSLEEFKIIYESAEKVTDRRLATNKINYSIGAAALIANALIYKFSVEKSLYAIFGLSLIIAISFFAIKFCKYWILQIEDFKSLNAAKFKILNEMAPYIHFNKGDCEYPVLSYEPFSKEWTYLEQAGALQEKVRGNEKALKSSDTELFLPKIFSYLFVIIIIITILTFIIKIVANWEKIMNYCICT